MKIKKLFFTFFTLSIMSMSTVTFATDYNVQVTNNNNKQFISYVVDVKDCQVTPPTGWFAYGDTGNIKISCSGKPYEGISVISFSASVSSDSTSSGSTSHVIGKVKFNDQSIPSCQNAVAPDPPGMSVSSNCQSSSSPCQCKITFNQQPY